MNSQQTASKLLQQLTLEEKAKLCSGNSFWHLHPIERLDLPSIMVCDGPHGLRKQDQNSDHLGLVTSVPAVCFPTASCSASSWDRDLLRQMGQAIGEEAKQEQVSVVLGPGVNIKRSPLCGRNFEYFSEDPLLAGELATAWIDGVQSQGIGTSLKHFAANNQERNRMVIDTIVDERTLREIYLPGFELAVKQSQPWTVMCAYNQLNGEFLAEHSTMLSDILKQEWAHTGLVVTDWGAINERVDGIKAGLELEMPSSGEVNTQKIITAVNQGTLTTEQLDRAVIRVLELIIKAKHNLVDDYRYDVEAHHRVAQQVAEQSMVLLKNRNNVLPLSPQLSYAVIGQFAKTPRFQGGGSSQINPTQIDNAYDSLCELLEKELPFAQGYHLDNDELDSALIEDAVAVASSVDQLVIFAGLPDSFESEGFDRQHMRMPVQQLRLIERLSLLNKPLIVVLSNGSPIELPFADKVDAILEGYLAGQAGGSAAARILTGAVNPSGKLAESFPIREKDCACHDFFPGHPRQADYREGIWVGYRYFNSAKTPLRYPFGHGLSYTQFQYSDLEVEVADKSAISTDNLEPWQGLKVHCTITNTGERAGAEVVQLYIGDLTETVHRPELELKGFEKVWLEPNQSKQVSFNLGHRSFAFWERNLAQWAVASGQFTIAIGRSSRDIELEQTVHVESSDKAIADPFELAAYKDASSFDPTLADFAQLLGREVPTPRSITPYSLNSTLHEIRDTVVGRKIYDTAVAKTAEIMGGDLNKLPEVTRNMVYAVVGEMPLRNLVHASQGEVSPKKMAALIGLMNHQPVTVLKALLNRA